MRSKWEKRVLSEVIQIISGGTPKRAVPEYWGEDIPWISIQDFNNVKGRYIRKTEEAITEEGYANSSTNILAKEDIIISARGTVGKLAMISKPMAFNQSCYGIRAHDEKLNPCYLFYYLKNNIESVQRKGHGSVFNTITRDTFRTIDISIPPIKEQKAIADTLSALDDKIELNNKINENLEAQAQAIFKHWFIDFEFPDENGNPYKSSGGEMVESELGMIPKGWEVVKLNSLIDRIDNRGKTPPYAKEKTKFPLLDVATLRGDNRIIDYNKVTKYVSEKTYNTWFRSGHPKSKDILISTVGSLAELKLFIGNIGCIAQNVVALRSKGISECYLYEYLKFIKKDLASYDIGSVQPSIKITHIINHPILVPEEKCIQRYHDICKKMTNRIYLNSLENQTLSQLRDTLLPKLMSGEIRVALEEQ